MQEKGAFDVGQWPQGIILVLPVFEVQRPVWRRVSQLFETRPEFLNLSKKRLFSADVLKIKQRHVLGDTFVQPEVRPGSDPDRHSPPLMGELMCREDNVALLLQITQGARWVIKANCAASWPNNPFSGRKISR